MNQILNRNRIMSDRLISALVATGETDGEANETATTHDDFENLRVLREKERSERQKQKLEQFTLINDQ